MEATTERREGVEYTLRPYETGDADGFLALYETVWGVRHGHEWFAWRYEDTPFLDHVPVFVAEADGEVVATRPYFGLEMVVGDRQPLGLLTTDTMVHPDHRGRGLFTTLTDRTLGYYGAGDPAFVFNQPNAAARRGFLNLGWRQLRPDRTHFRVQNPQPLLESRYNAPAALSRPSKYASSVYHAVSSRGTHGRRDHTVRASRGVRSTELAELYRRRPPPEIHARRTEEYYDWRFASPEWSRTTYLADRGPKTTVGLVSRTRTDEEGSTVTQIADVVPLVGDDEWERGLASVLEALLRDRADADVIAAPSDLLPAGLFSDYEFRASSAVPIRWFRSHDPHLCVRTLQSDGSPWTIDGVRLDDPRQWRLSFGERDTT